MHNENLSLQGVFPALVTPFDPRTEEVDEEGFRRLIRRVLPHVNGVVTGGTTGECAYLSRAEQRRLVEIARQEMGDGLVVAGCSASGAAQALALAADAQEAGADAILVVTPYYIHPADQEVYQHFADIATGVDIPLILYNIPQVVDRVLPCAVVDDLADLPNVVALKDSSGNLSYLLEILERAGDRIAVLVGYDEIVLPALASGASGAILASAQVYPEVWQEVLRLVEGGRLAEAREAQQRVQRLSQIFCRHGGGVAVKAALNVMGVPVGPPRRPLKETGGVLSHEVRAEIEQELEKLGKVVAAAVEPFAFPTGPLEERFGDLELTVADVRAHNLRLGSGTAGGGRERVQLDLVVGGKGTLLGEVFALQLTRPPHGRAALTASPAPGRTARPAALLLLPGNLRRADGVSGAASAALARAIADALAAGIIPPSAAEDEVMLLLAALDPAASERRALSRNVYDAAQQAITQAFWRG